MTTLKQDFTGVISVRRNAERRCHQTRAKTPRRGVFYRQNLSLRLSYHVFNAFNFDLYATIRSQQSIRAARGFTLSQVLPVTGLDSPIPRAEICQTEYLGDQVINNRLSTFLGQTPVVSASEPIRSVKPRTTTEPSFRIRVAQLSAVQLIQSLLAFRLQVDLLKLNSTSDSQRAEVFGLYSGAGAGAGATTEQLAGRNAVGNTYAQQAVVRRCRWRWHHRCC